MLHRTPGCLGSANAGLCSIRNDDPGASAAAAACSAAATASADSSAAKKAWRKRTASAANTLRIPGCCRRGRKRRGRSAEPLPAAPVLLARARFVGATSVEWSWLDVPPVGNPSVCDDGGGGGGDALRLDGIASAAASLAPQANESPASLKAPSELPWSSSSSLQLRSPPPPSSPLLSANICGANDFFVVAVPDVGKILPVKRLLSRFRPKLPVPSNREACLAVFTFKIRLNRTFTSTS